MPGGPGAGSGPSPTHTDLFTLRQGDASVMAKVLVYYLIKSKRPLITKYNITLWTTLRKNDFQLNYDMPLSDVPCHEKHKKDTNDVLLRSEEIQS